MGTHPSGPAFISNEGQGAGCGLSLKEVFQRKPEYVGTIPVIERYGNDIPFLLKVLSIGQPLSIQSHPDKETARKLHSRDPHNYPDDNHKPEMAIALTEFEALCSFRPHDQLCRILKEFPEIRNIIGHSVADRYIQSGQKDDLRQCFKNILIADDKSLHQTIESLNQRWNSLKINPEDHLLSNLRHVFQMVRTYYPQDCGLLCMFFLNYVKLKPGEGIFLEANEPHSYLSGDCVECMAKSDNVIRAGFTPKFKDVEQLYRSLSYESVQPKSLIIRPERMRDAITFSYRTSAEEFAVDQIYINSDGAVRREFVFPRRESASILVVRKGKFSVKGLDVKASAGSVYLIPAALPVTFVSHEPELECYRAFIKPQHEKR